MTTTNENNITETPQTIRRNVETQKLLTKYKNENAMLKNNLKELKHDHDVLKVLFRQTLHKNKAMKILVESA